MFSGFMISADELERAQAEISEEDLGGVVGGVVQLGRRTSLLTSCWGDLGGVVSCTTSPLELK